jgi:hypothetical protein
MLDVITWLYLIGTPVVGIYGFWLWVLDAREEGKPVTKTQFGEAVVICSLLGMIWPIALVLGAAGLAIDWWLDNA